MDRFLKSESQSWDYKKRLQVFILFIVILLSSYYVYNSLNELSIEPTISTYVDMSNLKEQQLLESQYNPPANMSESDIENKKKLLKVPNPPSNLSSIELEFKKSSLKDI